MALVPTIKKDDWNSVRQAIQKLASSKLGPDASPTFAGLTLTDLTASRLIWSNAAKTLVSKDLIDLVVGTDNQIIVTDDGAGGLVLSTPQDIHVDATPEFAGITIKDSEDDIIFYVDDDEMYFTASVVIEIADGMPIGLLLALTYKT